MSESDIIQVDPEIENYVVLPGGDYGMDGHAELRKLKPKNGFPFDADLTGVTYVLSIFDPNAEQALPVIDSVPNQPGSKNPKFLRQLGITDEQMRAGMDIQTAALHLALPCKVKVRLAVREWKDKTTGETKATNTIEDISKIVQET